MTRPTADSRPRWSGLQGLLQSRRAGQVALLIAGVLFVAQSTRAVLAFSREHGHTGATHPAGTLQGAAADRGREGGVGHEPAAEGAESPLPIVKRLPSDQQPGWLLSDLFEILREAGIDTYRYRLLLGADRAGEIDGERVVPIDDAPIQELLPPPGEDPWIGDELVPLDLAGVELPPLPPGVRKWEVALSVRASYARLLHALRLLEADERLWDVPRLSVRRGERGTEAELRLLTYAGDTSGVAEREEVRVPVPAPVSLSSRDPFGRAEEGRAAERSSLQPPRLGAVRLGAGEAAWLDGQSVRPGESCGAWTLLSVRSNEVRVRHESGREVRIPLEEPPGKEASDARP